MEKIPVENFESYKSVLTEKLIAGLYKENKQNSLDPIVWEWSLDWMLHIYFPRLHYSEDDVRKICSWIIENYHIRAHYVLLTNVISLIITFKENHVAVR